MTPWTVSLGNRATINHVTTMLAISKIVLFPGHYHLLTTVADDPSLLALVLG